jgi:hypothetical protein
MKIITSILCGLCSSLLLSVGLSRLAQKLDPVSWTGHEWAATAHGAALTSICGFPARRGSV